MQLTVALTPQSKPYPRTSTTRHHTLTTNATLNHFTQYLQIPSVETEFFGSISQSVPTSHHLYTYVAERWKKKASFNNEQRPTVSRCWR
eukprot:scaffold749_cov193-Alexandrium_tamarense.AAC.9